MGRIGGRRVKNVRDVKLKYTAKATLPPTGRRKTPSQAFPRKRGRAPRRENYVLVIGEEASYWVKIKQARYMLRDRLAVMLSSQPFVIEALPIIERVYSCLVCRRLRVHREELIHQVSVARTGKPRRAYAEYMEDTGYIPLPCDFGREINDRT